MPKGSHLKNAKKKKIYDAITGILINSVQNVITLICRHLVYGDPFILDLWHQNLVEEICNFVYNSIDTIEYVSFDFFRRLTEMMTNR